MTTDIEKRNRRIQQENEARRRLMARKYEKVFAATPEAIEVFNDLMSYCHVFTTSFTGNSQTFFNEGKRQVGLYLLGMRDMAHIDGLRKIQLQKFEAQKNELLRGVVAETIEKEDEE